MTEILEVIAIILRIILAIIWMKSRPKPPESN